MASKCALLFSALSRSPLCDHLTFTLNTKCKWNPCDVFVVRQNRIHSLHTHLDKTAHASLEAWLAVRACHCNTFLWPPTTPSQLFPS